MTEAMTETLLFIAMYIARHQYPPSLTEIAESRGSGSSSGHTMIKRLEGEGYILRERTDGPRNRRWRSLIITQKGWDIINARTRDKGKCYACGKPL